MPRLNEWFFGRKDALSLLLALVFSLILLFSNENQQIQALRALSLDGFGFFLSKVAAFNDLYDLYDENKKLRLENASLMLENSRLNEAFLENLRLRELLGFKSESHLELIPAKVIGKENNGLINTIILAAGKDDSLHKNMAIVTAQGLVGKLLDVGVHHSAAQLLLDRNFRVSAMVQRSRVMGIIKWSEGNRVFLSEVPKRSDVDVEDVVVTSGFSTIFPAGLEIGRIIKVENEQELSMFMNILIEPAVDFAKLEEVFVIKNLPEQAP
ncbi:MAG: rod shape-determining protein MreC [bacterium]